MTTEDAGMPETEQQQDSEEQQQEAVHGNGAGGRRAEDGRNWLERSSLKEMTIQALNQMAKDLGVEGAAGMKKHDLIFKILQSQTEKSGLLFAAGVLQCLPDRHALLARPG